MARLPQLDQANSVFLFPGINSITRIKDRIAYLQLPEVQERLRLAEQELEQIGEHRSLSDHLQLDEVEICKPGNLPLKAICVIAIQLGITDCLRERGIVPHWLMGCSMGDLARSVYGGVLPFKKIVPLHYDFSLRYIESAARIKGVNLGIRTPALQPLKRSDMNWFESHGITVSWMSPNNAQASCDHSAYEILCTKAQAMNWRIKKFAFDTLFHARQLREFSNRTINIIKDSSYSEPRLKMYSSVLNRPVNSLADLELEARESIWRPIRWYEAVVGIREHCQVRRFINIGPGNSLIALHKNISRQETVIDALSLIDSN